MQALRVLPTSTLEAVPLVFSEQRVSLFKFYRDQSIRDGMLYRNELYQSVREFGIRDRLKAYQFACEQFEQGIPNLITVSEHRYVVWVNLRGPLAATSALR